MELYKTYFGVDSKLFEAAKVGDLTMVKTQFGKGASVNSQKYGHCAVHWAALRGHSDVLKFLIENGADLTARTKSDGWTVVHMAAWTGKLEIVKYLVGLGCDLSIKDHRGRTAADLVIEDAAGEPILLQVHEYLVQCMGGEVNKVSKGNEDHQGCLRF